MSCHGPWPKCPTVVVLGDLNLDRLKPREREGKILIDLKKVHPAFLSYHQTHTGDPNPDPFNNIELFMISACLMSC